MKYNKIFASIIVAIMLTNGAAKAETASTKNDTSNLVKSKIGYNKLLANGRESDFAAYQIDLLPSVAFSNEVRTFNKVISQYNSNATLFLNTSTTDKAQFNNGAKVLINILEKMKTKQAQNWLSTIKQTTNTANLLWELNRELQVIDSNDASVEISATAL